MASIIVSGSLRFFTNNTTFPVVSWGYSCDNTVRHVAIFGDTDLPFDDTKANGTVDENGLWTWDGKSDTNDENGLEIGILYARADKENWEAQE